MGSIEDVPTCSGGNKNSDYFKLQEATSVVSELISRRKKEYQKHLALKLSDPMTNAKTYWSLLKTFYKGKKSTNYTSIFN